MRFKSVFVSATLMFLIAINASELSIGGRDSHAQDAVKPSSRNSPQPVAQGKAEDRAAIQAVLNSVGKAFTSRDAKALAPLWTSDGEFHSTAGISIHGRDAIEKEFTAFFAKTPEVKAEIRSETLRFVAKGAAIDEGSVSVQRGPMTPTTKARYKALFVREDNRWSLAQFTESPSDDKVLISDLDWLIGEWKSISGQDAEIQTTYAWAPNKKFIHVQFVLKEKAVSLSGSQVIGVDPATGGIRSWIFDVDGGVGESDWSRDGDHWTIRVDGTLTDGSSLIETNILRRVSSDVFTWQSVDRTLDDKDLPDLAPVKLTRVKAQK